MTRHCPMNTKRHSRRAQRGATLLVSMIFLVIITLVVVSAVKVSTLNIKMVGNTQTERESAAAAQQAIEGTISTDFTQLPVDRTTTINSGSAGADYSVLASAPVCTGVKAIKMSELDAANANDQPCYASGAAANTGIVGAGAGGNSLCSSSNWDLSAAATDPSGTSTGPKTHQGVSVRVAVGAAC